MSKKTRNSSLTQLRHSTKHETTRSNAASKSFSNDVRKQELCATNAFPSNAKQLQAITVISVEKKTNKYQQPEIRTEIANKQKRIPCAHEKKTQALVRDGVTRHKIRKEAEKEKYAFFCRIWHAL